MSFYDVTILFTKLAKVNDKEAFMLPLIRLVFVMFLPLYIEEKK